MKAREMPAREAAITIPSISMCGDFCISSRSLKVPARTRRRCRRGTCPCRPWAGTPTFAPPGSRRRRGRAARRPRARRRPPRGSSRAPCAAPGSRRGARRPRACGARARRSPSSRIVVALSRALALSAARSPGAALALREPRRERELLRGIGSRPARRSSTQPRAVGRLERPDRRLDGHHRRDVARAEALEARRLTSPSRPRLLQRGVELVRAAQRAGDVGAHIDAWRPTGAARTCRRRSRPSSGRRASRASRRRPARSPPASTSRGGAALRRAPAALRSGGRGRAPSRLDLAAKCGGHLDQRGLGNRRRLLVEVGGLVPAGHARAVRAAGVGRRGVIDRSRRGSGRASRAWRSGRRCRRHGPSARSPGD